MNNEYENEYENNEYENCRFDRRQSDRTARSGVGCRQVSMRLLRVDRGEHWLRETRLQGCYALSMRIDERLASRHKSLHT